MCVKYFSSFCVSCWPDGPYNCWETTGNITVECAAGNAGDTGGSEKISDDAAKDLNDVANSVKDANLNKKAWVFVPTASNITSSIHQKVTCINDDYSIVVSGSTQLF